MKLRPIRIARDSRGSSAVEFALAVPVLVSMIWGVFQIALVLEANAGMQNALGQAARYSTIYRVDTSDHRPTDTEIGNYITNNKFGLSRGTWGTPSIETDATAGTKTITVTYTQPLDFLLFQGPSVTLTKSKVVYMSV
jgi:Flp pilus assembly protein TadG